MPVIGDPAHPDAGPRPVVPSRAQQEFWLLEQLFPASPALRISRAFRVLGPCDVPALRLAWREVLARHDVLRTTLADEDGRARSRPAGEPSFTFTDLVPHAPAERRARAGELAAEAVAAARLGAGSPAFLAVHRVGAADHRIVLVLHRAVADEDSASRVVEDLSDAYARSVSGAVPDLPLRSGLPYAEFARQLAAHAAGPASRAMAEWWRAELTPPPAPVVLPGDRDGQAPPGPDGVAEFAWPAFAAPLARLAAAEAVTPTAVLLAAYHTLLRRYGAEGPVPVLVPRPLALVRHADVVGPREALTVVCCDPAPGASFRTVVRSAAAALRAAGEHCGPALGDVVRSAGIEVEPGRFPFGGAVFVPHPRSRPVLRIGDADVLELPLPAGRPAADLTLTVTATAPAVTGSLAWSGERFGAATGAVVLDQFATVLGEALQRPDEPIEDLRVDGPDRAAALAAAADGLAAARPAEPVQELVRRRAAEVPDAVAARDADVELTYAALERATTALAVRLAALGAEGVPVAIRTASGPWQLAASLAVLRAGGHLLWFGPSDLGERGRYILAEQRPACLLTDLDDELTRWFRDELGGRVLPVRHAAEDDSGARPARDGVGERRPLPAVGGDSRVYVAYTSGSTGRPKAIAQSHAAFAQFATWMSGAFDLGPGARVAQWVAPDHDPSLCEVFATLTGGGTLCAVPDRIRVHPEKFARWLAAERITFLQTVPSFAGELLTALEAGGGSLPAMTHLVLMGEALPGVLVDRVRAQLPGVRLFNMYGPTETIAATWHEITGPVDGVVPIGRPIPGRELLVLDPTGRPCPAGVTGEIVIRSPAAVTRYAGEVQEPRVFEPVPGSAGLPCYRTGDLARWRPDGLLEFRGRRDFQVKLQGNRIELAEVEAALAGHPAVAECAVVPQTRADGLVVRLVAHVVPGPAAAGPAEAVATREWRALLRRRFGAAMALVTLRTRAEPLPRNVAGKVDRARLPAGTGPETAGRAPRAGLEAAVAEVWQDLLGPAAPPVLKADDEFFAAGGDSLSLPRLAVRLQQRFGAGIPLTAGLGRSTVAGLAAAIAAELGEPDEAAA
ncbi:AMP-binding protein [Amycolatopsis sp. NPDC098790]|uniref:AMP-binding protein n=1 Tax=Amycolatopsis sp. NPDC098790 TaxID=3363939 RepID=UPI00381E9240